VMCFLYHNKGNGTFEEVALTAGAGYNEDGKPYAGMGVDFADYDNDGRPDIFTVALNAETFPLFHNEGKGVFRDATSASRRRASSRCARDRCIRARAPPSTSRATTAPSGSSARCTRASGARWDWSSPLSTSR